MLREKLKQHRDDIIFTAVLAISSMILYIIHYLLFNDIHHISIFALSDLAFVPIEVIFVSLILHRVLSSNEKKKKSLKLYMVIEVFFSGMGFEILHILAGSDQNIEEVQDDFIVGEKKWNKKAFKKRLRSYEPDLALTGDELSDLLDLLEKEKSDIQRMIENPMLLEHETFSELLMAVYHLYKELSMRTDLNDLDRYDKAHLIGDAKRAYILLCIEWIEYLNHMRDHYPYLYNFSLRVNPYEEEMDAEVK
jgi:hypothetical protein